MFLTIDQKESDRKLGERIVDIGFWRNEITTELERLLDENKKMRECFQVLEEVIKNNSQPLNITEECLYQRENRIGKLYFYDLKAIFPLIFYNLIQLRWLILKTETNLIKLKLFI